MEPDEPIMAIGSGGDYIGWRNNYGERRLWAIYVGVEKVFL
jgi:ATP-dependent protease HslVU (ClpYQ) peptidase subunit